jgi:hypothetical protein
MRLRYPVSVLVLLAILSSVLAGAAAATQVWSGRTFTFSKAANANPSLAANQDRITATIWITRAATQGVYNAFTEAGYVHNVSPAGTEWSDGDAVNHGALTFSPWEVWNGASPPTKVGVNACVHLIADDIFIDIRFVSWAATTGGGGAFSYIRAVQPTGTPVELGTWGALKALYR